MYPILFEWGPLRIGSYGVLLACAFLGAIFVTNREFRRHQADLTLAWDIYLLAIVGGLVGSRLLYVFESWKIFLEHPWQVIASPTGFSVIGGYLLALVLCAWRVRQAGESFRRMADLCAPGMAIGYAIGRLGCITAGDGCYGLPTLGWYGMTFPHGLVSTLKVTNPHLKELFMERYPGIPVPDDIPVHPTPLYESLSSWALLMTLLAGRWSIGSGLRFAFFLGWYGASRFFVEFIRLNPIFWRNLTSDQLLAVGLVAASVVFALTGTRPIEEVRHADTDGNAETNHETPG